MYWERKTREKVGSKTAFKHGPVQTLRFGFLSQIEKQK